MTDQPFQIFGTERKSRWVITCDHASNRVPDFVKGGDLGLPPEDMGRHIAYDIGAAGVACHLGRLLDAPVILSNFSRLVIDPNRGEDDPTLIMQLYDGTIVPGNRDLGSDERQMRMKRCYLPYHEAVAQLFESREAPAMVAVHSFTPRLNGRHPRPWHIGLLHAWDERLSAPLLQRLHATRDILAAANVPYAGHLPGDAVDRHALKHGRANVLIELRQDLIETEAGQEKWAGLLAEAMDGLLEGIE